MSNSCIIMLGIVFISLLIVYLIVDAIICKTFIIFNKVIETYPRLRNKTCIHCNRLLTKENISRWQAYVKLKEGARLTYIANRCMSCNAAVELADQISESNPAVPYQEAVKAATNLLKAKGLYDNWVMLKPLEHEDNVNYIKLTTNAELED
mgnify:CR=1 FL=1